jgi:hypothetical protein
MYRMHADSAWVVVVDRTYPGAGAEMRRDFPTKLGAAQSIRRLKSGSNVQGG